MLMRRLITSECLDSVESQVTQRILNNKSTKPGSTHETQKSRVSGGADTLWLDVKPEVGAPKLG